MFCFFLKEDALGTYIRFLDTDDGRSVYKQVSGFNYLYYLDVRTELFISLKNNVFLKNLTFSQYAATWMVGPRVGVYYEVRAIILFYFCFCV